MPDVPTVYISGDCPLVAFVFLMYFLGKVALVLGIGYLLLRLGRFIVRIARGVWNRVLAPEPYVRVEVIEPGEWRPQDQLDSLSRRYLMERIRQFMAGEEV
jgi:hypothetical protein